MLTSAVDKTVMTVEGTARLGDPAGQKTKKKTAIHDDRRK
jgi:hypothetical protein